MKKLLVLLLFVFLSIPSIKAISMDAATFRFVNDSPGVFGFQNVETGWFLNDLRPDRLCLYSGGPKGDIGSAWNVYTTDDVQVSSIEENVGYYVKNVRSEKYISIVGGEYLVQSPTPSVVRFVKNSDQSFTMYIEGFFVLQERSSSTSLQYGTIIDGMLFCPDEDRTGAILLCTTAPQSAHFVIPESVILDGKACNVTEIGREVFRDCRSLTSVTIPSSVTSIGEYAFSGCSGLTSVTIPEGVTSIGWGAFYSCSSLTSVTIPKGVKSIGASAFYNCSSLTNVTIPKGVISIGKEAFYGCTKLAEVTIGSNFTSSIFCQKSNLVSYASKIVIEEGVSRIGSSAFSDCSSLTSVTIPSSVTSIGESAFNNCSGLTSVTIPSTVTSIGKDAFYNCNNLTNVIFPQNIKEVSSYNSVYSIRLNGTDLYLTTKWVRDNSGVTYSISKEPEFFKIQSYDDCFSIQSTSSGRHVGYSHDWRTTDTDDVWDISSIEGVPTTIRRTNGYLGCNQTYEGSGVFTDKPSGNLWVFEYQYSTPDDATAPCFGENAFKYCNSLTSVTIPEGVKIMGKGAFYGCTSLTDVLIPSSVVSVGESAFENCTCLTNATILEGVISIGNRAFYNCSGITNMTIPSSVKSIDENAFGDCYGLTNLTILEGVMSIGEYAFSGCRDLTSVVFPSSVTNIGNYAFYDCSNITGSLVLPSVRSIGNFAFYKCSNFTGSLILPSSVRSIGDYAFYDCSGLTSLELSEGITSIGNHAFRDCSSLTSITIPSSVTNIGENAFNGCANFYDLVIPSGVTSLGSNAFGNCSKLKNLTILSNYVAGLSGFSGYFGSQVTNLEYGNDITTINNSWSNTLNSVIVGPKVAKIGNGGSAVKAIWLCNTCPEGAARIDAKVNYVSNSQFEGLTNVKKYSSLSSLFDVDGVKYVLASASQRTCDVIDCQYDNRFRTDLALGSSVQYKGIDLTLENVGDYAFYAHPVIKTANVDGSGSIGVNAFANCSQLAEVTLGDGVTEIKNNALANCSQLAEVTLGDNVAEIKDGAFLNDKALAEISIPASVARIGTDAFNGCTALKHFSIEDRNATLDLGQTILKGCPLDYVYVGGKITYDTSAEAGYSPFYNNKTLQSVYVTDAEDTIYDNEFYGCAKLKTVKIGNGVKTIGKWAFSGCANLESFSFGRHLESIGQEAFSDCTALTSIMSEALTPPVCGAQALEDINKWECKLYVPESSISDYQAAEQWKDFFFVEKNPDFIMQYTIVATASDVTMGTVVGAGIYNEGDTVTLTAVPNEGYIFVGWSDGSTDNPYTFKAGADKNVTALFEQDPMVGLHSIEEEPNAQPVYDLTGRRVQSNSHTGVSIIRGRKVIR